MESLAERQARQSLWRRLITPLLFAALLIVVCVWAAGSSFIEIEDHYANEILGGGWGSYDPLVSFVHPWAGRIVTALYSLAPAVNWYGVSLLALLFLSGAAALSLAAHRAKGLVPGIVLLTPILALFACELQSMPVAGLCAVSGVLAVLDGLSDGARGAKRTVLGLLLTLAGCLFSMELAWVMAAGTLLIAAAAGQIQRPRALTFRAGVPLVLAALLVPTLAGQLDPVWGPFHRQTLAYEQALHTDLTETVRALNSQYGVIIDMDAGGAILENDADESLPTQEEALRKTPIPAIGWTLGDADLFLRRTSVDSEIVSPEAVAAVNREAGKLHLAAFAANFKTTIVKLQFLMLLALFLFAALCLMLFNRARGFAVLVAAVFALGGHVLLTLFGRVDFKEIAPFYILGIVSLLYQFDPERAVRDIRKAVPIKALRVAGGAAVLAVFVMGMAVLVWQMRAYNQAQSPSVAARQELSVYMDALPDAVFIGDNPLDRYNPDALTPPEFGGSARLLAGSYDLYSPRWKTLADAYGIQNPLKDAVNRLDIVYIDMSGSTLNVAAARSLRAYGQRFAANTPTLDGMPLNLGESQHRMQVYWLTAITEAEYEEMVASYEGAE